MGSCFSMVRSRVKKIVQLQKFYETCQLNLCIFSHYICDDEYVLRHAARDYAYKIYLLCRCGIFTPSSYKITVIIDDLRELIKTESDPIFKLAYEAAQDTQKPSHRLVNPKSIQKIIDRYSNSLSQTVDDRYHDDILGVHELIA